MRRFASLTSHGYSHLVVDVEGNPDAKLAGMWVQLRLGPVTIAEVRLSTDWEDIFWPNDPKEYLSFGSTELEVPLYFSGHVCAVEAKFFSRIFGSYAPKDIEIVRAVDSILGATGRIDFRWDMKVLRAGDDRDVLKQEISFADSFQLFWSHSASRSRYVREEMNFALGLERIGFIKPVCWEDVVPLLPSGFRKLHIARIYLAAPESSIVVWLS